MTWECPNCTFNGNPDDEAKCQMCMSDRPTSRAAPVARRRSLDSARDAPRDERDGASGTGASEGASLEVEMSSVHTTPSRARPSPGSRAPRPSGMREGSGRSVASLDLSGCCRDCCGDLMESETFRAFCVAFTCVVLFISCFLIGFSFRIVDYDEYGLLRAELSGAIVDEKVYQTGRHFVGLGFVFVTLKKNMRTVEFKDGGTSGPISIRTIDGKIIVIEAAFDYILMESKIYDIYLEYGETAEEYFVTMARARLRDVAARHSAREFFADRRQIELAMQKELHSSLVPRMANVIEFQLGRVGLPFTLEAFLAETQLKKIKLQEEIENLLVKQIRANTSVEIARARADKESDLTIIRQETENLQLRVALERLEITETTAVMVAKVEAESNKKISVYNQETENRRLNLVINTTVAKGTTNLQEAQITLGTERLRADTDVTKAVINAEAQARVVLVNAAANAKAFIATGASVTNAFTDLKNNLSFNASHFNTLEWQKAIAGHDQASGEMYMDTQRPGQLRLPGQKDTLYKVLNSN